MSLKTLHDIGNFDGVKVLVRVDFNVPIKNGMITDDFRIKAALPTIDFLRQRGAKVILISHIEVREGEVATLEPISQRLEKLGVPNVFVENWKNAFEIISNMSNADCVLLENLREFDGEKENDVKFSRELASLADIYVNDAFSVSHRKHASVVGVPEFIPGYAGLQVEKEVQNLSKVFTPEHPFLFVLGGAKFDTKLPLLKKFVKSADQIFIGGALAHDIYKDRGYEIGQSLVSKEKVDLSAYSSNSKVFVSIDIVNTDRQIKMASDLSKEDRSVDVGPEGLAQLEHLIGEAKFVLWNGPLGLYEEGYKEGTLRLANLIAKRTGVVSIVGGGDTLSAISELGLEEKFTFISTAGGAMLDFLAKGSLPGLEALGQESSSGGDTIQ